MDLEELARNNFARDQDALLDTNSEEFVTYCMGLVHHEIATSLSTCKFQVRSVSNAIKHNKELDLVRIKSQLKKYISGTDVIDAVVPMCVYLEDPATILQAAGSQSFYSALSQSPSQYPDHNLVQIRARATALYTPFIDNIRDAIVTLLYLIEKLEKIDEATLVTAETVPLLTEIFEHIVKTDKKNNEFRNKIPHKIQTTEAMIAALRKNVQDLMAVK